MTRKHVLITAGPVYGRLDDNKLISNRARGIWAVEFAHHLAARGYKVTLLIAETFKMPAEDLSSPIAPDDALSVLRHDGFEEYMETCLQLAPEVDAAVLAAAVVNWIPAEPYEGKMPTEGYEEGDIIQIPFRLAPRVIDRMKELNPKLTLIGCKMLSGAAEQELLDTAYEKVLLASRCNAVVANDMRLGLRLKWVVYPDRAAFRYDDDFRGFFKALRGVIDDRHWRTAWTDRRADAPASATQWFDNVVRDYRGHFVHPVAGRDMVFGSVAVQVRAGDKDWWLCSPREKGEAFTAKDAVAVTGLDWEANTAIVCSRGAIVGEAGKATLNAPLLIRYALLYRHTAIVHLHEQIEGLPTLPYAPPGTVRDNNRELSSHLLAQGFNIEGHGCVLPAGPETAKAGSDA